MIHEGYCPYRLTAGPRWYIVRGMVNIDLDLNDLRLPVGLGGRRASPVAGRVLREIETSDLPQLTVNRGTKPDALKSIRHRHHALARALASGMRDWEAAVATGYNISTISTLKADSMFQELLAFYESEANAPYIDMHQRLADLSQSAAEELQVRLEETPEDLSVNQLQDLVKLGADRTGHGPASTSTQVNVNIDLADRLAAARKRIAERTIEATPNEPENGS